jgi:hypothetical protein
VGVALLLADRRTDMAKLLGVFPTITTVLNTTTTQLPCDSKYKPRIISQINLLKPTAYVMHQQFNIQQLYALPTLYLCVLCLSENEQRFVPLTA